jgi:hypothetical protein
MWMSRKKRSGRVLLDHGIDVAAVFHLVADLELRPEAREPRAEHRAQQRFVVGNYRGCQAGTSIEATTPLGAFSSRTRFARPP